NFALQEILNSRAIQCESVSTPTPNVMILALRWFSDKFGVDRLIFFSLVIFSQLFLTIYSKYIFHLLSVTYFSAYFFGNIFLQRENLRTSFFSCFKLISHSLPPPHVYLFQNKIFFI